MAAVDEVGGAGSIAHDRRLAWHVLCGELGTPTGASLPEVLVALEATAVPLEVARRILRPSDRLAS